MSIRSTGRSNYERPRKGGKQALKLASIAPPKQLLEPLAVSVNEAARLTNSSRTQIYRQIRRGELETVQDGSRRKVIFASVKARMARLLEASRAAKAHAAERIST